MSNKLNNAIKSIEEKWGKGAVLKFDREKIVDIPRISSGNPKIDNILGGGYPEGLIIEIMGWESSGKSSLCLLAIAGAQKSTNRLCAYIDVEHTFDPKYAELLGVDVENLYLAQPSSGEEAGDIMEQLVMTGEFSLVVVDSVAALTPQAEIEGDFGDSKMGLQARLMSQMMRKITSPAKKNRTTLIFINQFREKIGVMYGSPTTTTGGNALKFYAAQRIEVIRGKTEKVGETPVSYTMKIKVKKNKVSTPFMDTEVNFLIGKGFDEKVDEMESLYSSAIEQGVLIVGGGGYVKYGDMNIGQGKKKVMKMFEDNPELVEDIKKDLV